MVVNGGWSDGGAAAGGAAPRAFAAAAEPLNVPGSGQNNVNTLQLPGLRR